MAKKKTFTQKAYDVEVEKKAGVPASTLAAGIAEKKRKQAERDKANAKQTVVTVTTPEITQLTMPGKKAGTFTPIGSAANAPSNARYGVEEYDDAYSAYLKQMLAQATNSPGSIMNIANHLKSDEMIDMAKLGFKRWNDDTAAAALLGQGEMLDYFRQIGYFDQEEFLNRNYITEPTTSYLQNQLPLWENKIEESRQADNQAELYESTLDSTRRGWEQLEAEAKNPSTFDPMYGYAMMEYLQGDRSEPFNYDEWDYQYQMLDPQEQQTRLAGLQDAWAGLDFDTLTGRNYTPYKSKTGEYQTTYDTISDEVQRRSEVEAFENKMRNSSNYGAGYVVPEDDKARVIMPGVGGEIRLTEIDTNTYDLQYLINNGRNIDLGPQLENSNPIVKYFLENGLNLMDQKQIDTYNAAVAEGGEKYGQQYIDLILPQLRYNKSRYEEQYLGAMATDNIVGPIMSAATVPMNIMGAGMTAIGAALGIDDPYAPIYGMSRTVDTYRGKRGDVYGEALPFNILGEKAGKLLYNIGMSTADMVAAQKFAGAVGSMTGKADAAKNIMGAVMSTEVGTDTFLSDLESGRGYEYAVLHGFTDGMISRVAESGFLDNLFSKEGKLVTNTLKAAGSEGLEEIFEEGGQIVSDAFFSYLTGQENQIQETYNYYVATLGADKAALETLKDFGQRFAIAGISGAVMGGGTAAVSNAGEYMDNRATGRAIQEQGDPEKMLEIAKSMPEDSKTRAIAVEIEGRVGKGKKMPLAELGKLTKTMAGELNEEMSQITNGVMEDAIVNRLVEVGSSREAAKKNAPAIRKIAFGEKVTMAERANLLWDDAADKVTKELTTKSGTVENRATGETKQKKWLQDMRIAQVEASGEVLGKQIDMQRAANTKNVSQTVKDAAAKGAAKVRKGKNGKPTGKPTARKIAFNDGTTKGEGDILRFEEQDGELKMVIQTEMTGVDGKKQKTERAVSLDSLVEAEGAGTAGIIEAVNDINETLHPVSAEEASTLLASYSTTGGDVGSFVENYERAYLAGYSGMENQKVALDPQLAKMARESGARQAEKDEQTRKSRASAYKAVSNPVAGWLGRVTSNDQVRGSGDEKALSGAMEAMTESQRMTADAAVEFGKAVGLNVVLFESDADRIGSIQNGSFDESTHTVYLDVNSGAVSAKDIQAQKDSGTLGYAIMRTLGHEVTHYLEVASPEMYAKYKAAVKEGLKAAGEDVAQLIRGKIDNALNDGRKLTYAAAEAEVIADASEYMLQDSKFTGKLDNTLRGKVKTFVQNFMQKVKEIFSNLTTAHRESKALREMVDGVYRYTGKLQELWDASMQEVLEKGTDDHVGGTTEMVEGLSEVPGQLDGMKYSIRDSYGEEITLTAEELEENKKTVSSMRNVSAANGNSYVNLDGAAYRRAVQGYFDGVGRTFDNPTIGMVRITTSGLKHLTRYKSKLKSALVPCVKDVIENGVIVDIDDNHDMRGEPTVVLAAPVTLDGKGYYMGVAVRQANNLDKLYHIHEAALIEQEKGDHPATKTEPLEAEPSPDGHPSIYSILESIRKYNRESDVFENTGEGMRYSTRDLTDTEEFKRWFSGSQVVNEDGTPKVMYHGTNSDKAFTVFDTYGGKFGLFGIGSYFTDDESVAESYTLKGRGSNPRVYAVYLSIKNPLDMDAEYDPDKWESDDPYLNRYFANAKTNEDAFRALTEYCMDEEMLKYEAEEFITDYILGKGFDGITHIGGGRYNKRDENRHRVYIAFEPEQIKSATDNTGTFDPDNPDIRYSTRDLPSDITVREFISEAGDDAASTIEEKNALKIYRKRLDEYKEATTAVDNAQRTLDEIIAMQTDNDITVMNEEMKIAEREVRVSKQRQKTAYNKMVAIEETPHVASVMAWANRFITEDLTGNSRTIQQSVRKAEATVAELERQFAELKAAMKTQSEADRLASQQMVDRFRAEIAKGKRKINALKSKATERVERVKTEYREREQRAREYRKGREELNKLRRRISRNVKAINTLRVRETDQKHVPQQLQHVADLVMQTFTDSSLGRLAFPEQKLLSLSSRYRALRELERDEVHYVDDEIEADIENLQDLGEAYSAMKNKEGNVPSHLSVEGVAYEMEILRGVDNIVANVLNMIDATNDNFLKDRTETFNEYAKNTGEELRKHEDHKLLRGKLGEWQTMLDDWLVKGNVTPVYFFKHLGNKGLQDVFDQIRQGQSEYARIVAEGKAFMEATRAKHNYGAWVNDGKLKMKTSQGHMIELTREEAAEIYAIAKREKANKLYQTEHLRYGGFQYKSVAEKLTEDKKTTVKNNPNLLDEADLNTIRNWLTEEQRAYADDLVGFLSTTMADYGNEASMAMFGYKKFNEQYYIPFHTVAEQRFLKGDEGPQGENAGTGRIKNSGFTKKLQHKANQTLVVQGISDTVADHIHRMAAYSAMVQPIENMKRLLNHQVLEPDGTSNTIRALIGQKYGQPTQDYLTQLLKDLNGATMSDKRASKWTDKMISAFKRGAVMASASVVLQQPTAMARAMAMISPKYFANNPFYRPSKGTWDEMMQYAGTAVIKDMGKFDVGMGLSATQYILDENLKMAEVYRRLRQEGKNRFVAGKGWADSFIEFITRAPGAADQWTWGLIWKAVKAEQAALHPNMNQSSEEFLQLCGDRFDDVIDQTQVYDSVLTRSNLMRSTSDLHKMATSFMSEPTLSLNMLVDAVRGFVTKEHSWGHAGRIIGSVVASQVLAGALAALVQAWNDDDDKRNWAEKYMDRATGNILDNLNPLGMIPYISDIMSMFEGYDVERPDMSAIKDVYDYATSYFKAYEDGGAPTWKQTENFVGTLANLLGIPGKNISREIRRTRNAIFNTEWSAPDAFSVKQAMLENTIWHADSKKAYYQRIMTALARGETEQAEDYKSYMLASKAVDEAALTEGIRGAYRDAYKKGGIDKEQAIDFLYDNGLSTGETEDERRKSAFETVDRWGEGSTNHSVYNTLKDAYKAINFSDIQKAWKELTNNGWSDKQVLERSRELLRELVQDGTLTTGQATQLLRKWCSYKKDSDNVDKPKEWLEKP